MRVMLNIEAMVERDLAEAKARRAAIRAGARQSEVMALFRITKDSARKLFAAAVVLPGRPSRETVFSRARIVEILSDLNSRPVPFPSEPLLKPREAAALLGIHPATFAWYRTERPDRAPAHVRVGVHLIRYEPEAVHEFATRGRA